MFFCSGLFVGIIYINSRGCSGNKFEGLWKRQQKRKKVGRVDRTWNVKEGIRRKERYDRDGQKTDQEKPSRNCNQHFNSPTNYAVPCVGVW